MSLINDALRRAKQNQQKIPPAPAAGPPLRPVEAAPRPGAGVGWWLPLGVAVVLVVAGLLLWSRHKTPALATTRELATSAATTSAPAPQVAIAQPKAPANPIPPLPNPEPTASVVPPKVEAASEFATAGSPPPTVQAESPPQTVAASNAPTVPAEPPAPKPEPLKLQGILYRPANPVAIINGKTVGVGDRVGDALVVAIHPDGVSLVVAGQTNVLSLAR